MTRPLFADAFAHHVWATLRVIDTCLRLTSEQLDATVEGTYGSIIDTVRHTVGADAGYLFVLTGGRVQRIDEEQMDLAALRATMDGHGPEWLRLLGQGHLDPDDIVVNHRDDGSESHAPLGIRLAQALHHGTDHRSQICTILTSLGLEPPLIDAWDYAEAQGRLKEVLPPG